MKRNAIRRDVFSFLLPALLVFGVGMAAIACEPLSLHVDLCVFLVQAIAGLVLIAVGLTIHVAANTLRRFYSSGLVIRDDHQLITHGIYRFARYPPRVRRNHQHADSIHLLRRALRMERGWTGGFNTMRWGRARATRQASHK